MLNIYWNKKSSDLRYYLEFGQNLAAGHFPIYVCKVLHRGGWLRPNVVQSPVHYPSIGCFFSKYFRYSRRTMVPWRVILLKLVVLSKSNRFSFSRNSFIFSS